MADHAPTQLPKINPKLPFYKHHRFLIILVGLLLLVLVGSLTYGSLIHKSKVSKNHQPESALIKKAKHLTNQLFELNSDLAANPTLQQEKEFTATSKIRLDTLKKMLDDGQISDVIALAKPGEFGNAPKEAEPYLEKKTKLKGKLTWVHGHETDKKGIPTSEYDEFHIGKSLTKNRLYLTKEPKEDQANSTVMAETLQFENVYVADTSNLVQVAAAPALASLSGTRKVAVLRVNFTSDTSQPFTTTDVQNAYFTPSLNSVDNFYQHISAGQLSITGDVYGYFTINADLSACNFSAWANSAQTAAQAAGVNLAGYDHIVYLLNNVNRTSYICHWSGLAILGGNTTWQNNGTDSARHELGHNFGMKHSHSYYSCVNGAVYAPLSDNCQIADYGDPLDRMGSGYYGINGFNRASFGWGTMQTISTSGTYTVDAMDGTGNNRMIRVMRSSGKYFYIQYNPMYCPFYTGTCDYMHNNYGYTADSSYHQGITIRYGGEPNIGGDVYVLNMNPIGMNPVTSQPCNPAANLPGCQNLMAPSFKFCRRDDGTNAMIIPIPAGCGGLITYAGIPNIPTTLVTPYPDGQSWKDTIGTGHSDITFKTLSISPTSATVQIDIPAQPCIVGSPTVSISPSNATVAPGVFQSYTVFVRNNDTVTCGNSTFNLGSAILPVGFSQTVVGSSSVSVAPGTTGTIIVNVSSPIYQAKTTSNSFSETVTDPTHGSSTSGAASYITPTTWPFLNCSHC